MYRSYSPSAFLLSTVLLLTLTVCGVVFCPMISAMEVGPEHQHGTMIQTGHCPDSLTSFDAHFQGDSPAASFSPFDLFAVMEGSPHPAVSYRWISGESPHRVAPLRFLLFSVFLN